MINICYFGNSLSVVMNKRIGSENRYQSWLSYQPSCIYCYICRDINTNTTIVTMLFFTQHRAALTVVSPAKLVYHDDVIKWKHFLRYWPFVNSPFTGELSAQRPVTRSFDVIFDLRLTEQLSKQSWGWWFETPSPPLRRHFNAPHIYSTWAWRRLK